MKVTPVRGAIAVMVALVAGCASVQQAVEAWGSVAVSNARATNDTLIEGYKVGICALPLSAIARHPEMIPAVRSLCLASGDKVSEEMLAAIERQAEAKR